MSLYNANAIVLRRINFGETDRIVTLYTRERGKLPAIAKGSRKPISRLAGATEVLTYGRFQLATGRNLDVVAQVDVKESFPRIRDDLVRTAYASYMAELVQALVEEHEPNSNLFDLILSAFYLMERPNDPEKIAHMFELKLMCMLGYEPVLDRCVRCREALPAGDIYFSPSLGGLVCRECGPLPEDAVLILPDTLEIMGSIKHADAPEIERVQVPRPVIDQIARCMRWYVRYRAERELKSLDFLQAVRVVE